MVATPCQRRWCSKRVVSSPHPGFLFFHSRQELRERSISSLFSGPSPWGHSLCAGVEARDEQPLDRSRLRNLSLLYPSGWPPQHAAGKTTSQSAGSCSGVAERIAGGRLSPALCCSLSPVGVSCSCSFALSCRAQLGRLGGSRSGLGSSNKIPVHNSLSLSLSLSLN